MTDMMISIQSLEKLKKKSTFLMKPYSSLSTIGFFKIKFDEQCGTVYIFLTDKP